MKTIKIVLLAGIFGILTGRSTFAVPLGITFDEGVPLRYWGSGWAAGNGFQYLHIISVVGESSPGAVDLGGANDILVKWDAPAGWLYVLNRPPVNVRTPAPQTETAALRQGSRDAFGDHSPGSSLAGAGFVALLLLGLKLRPGRQQSSGLSGRVEHSKSPPKAVSKSPWPITAPSKPAQATQPAWMDRRPPRRRRSRSKRARKNICSSHRLWSGSISPKRPA